MLLKTHRDCLALFLLMPSLTIAGVKLHFRGASQNPMPFLLWLEFFLEILQVSYQIIVLHTCQIWESCNNFNLTKHVIIVCCVFNGTQCMIWCTYNVIRNNSDFWILYINECAMTKNCTKDHNHNNDEFCVLK